MSTTSPLTPWTPAQPERRQGERRDAVHRWQAEHFGAMGMNNRHGIDRRTALQHYGEQAELAEALRDARRYRLLRSADWADMEIIEFMSYGDYNGHISGEALDSKLDQQLAAGSGEKS